MIGTCQSCNADTHVSQHPLGGVARRNCYLSISKVAKQNKIAGGWVTDAKGVGWTTTTTVEYTNRSGRDELLHVDEIVSRVNGDKNDQR